MPSKQNPKKRHHYVPRFYLDNFTIPPEHKHVATLKKSDGTSFIGASTKIALENDFYSIGGDPGYEDKLAELEAKWSVVHKKLLTCKNPIRLSREEKATYSEFIGYQFVRTVHLREKYFDLAKANLLDSTSSEPRPENKAKTRSIFATFSVILSRAKVEGLLDENTIKLANDEFGISENKLVEMFYKIIDEVKGEVDEVSESGIFVDRLKPNLEEHEKWLAVNTKQKHIAEIDDLARKKAEQIIQMDWVVIGNKTNIPFITSDNPIFASEHWALKGPRNKSEQELKRWAFNIVGWINWTDPDGAVNPDLVVILPLSPALMLLCRGQQFSDGRTTIEFSDSGLVSLFNDWFTFQAREYLFSSQRDFDFTKTLNSSNKLAAIVKDIVIRYVRGNSSETN